MRMNFVPECYFDTLLVKNSLGVDKVNHQHGCQTVIEELRTSRKLKDDFAVGIIDKDKRELKEIKRDYEILKEISTPHLIFLKHRNRKHYIIQLVPAIEQWILNIVKESKINIEDLKIPLDLEGLKEYTKYQFASEDEILKRLCKRLINSESKTMGTLTLWLKYLYDHNRNADINEMKKWD